MESQLLAFEKVTKERTAAILREFFLLGQCVFSREAAGCLVKLESPDQLLLFGVDVEMGWIGWFASVATAAHQFLGPKVLLLMKGHIAIAQRGWDDFAHYVLENPREVILLHHFLLIFDDIIPLPCAHSHMSHNQ